MHEYSLVSALIDQVQSQVVLHGAKGVHRLVVRIGELSGVEVDLLRTAYDTFREKTVCAEAPMDVVVVEARWECPLCGRAFARGERLRCEGCQRPARLVRGDEIILEKLEMEVDDV